MRRPEGQERWITWRTLRGVRTGTLIVAAILAFAAFANVAAYRDVYPTPASRLRLAADLGSSAVTRLFYGVPYDLAHVGGYAAWRVAGLFTVVVAVWAAFVTITALRGEEESGRWEIVLAGQVQRARATAAALLALPVALAVVWLAGAAGLVAGDPADMPLGESLYLSLSIVLCGAVFAAIAALLSQFFATARTARLAGGAGIGVFLLLRIAADTGSGTLWLHWLTPFGWAEEMRPFTGSQPMVVALPIAGTLAAALAAGVLSGRRDAGTAFLAEHDRARSRSALLGSVTALALREEIAALAAWLIGTAVFGALLGSLAKEAAKLLRDSASVSNFLGRGNLASAEGYLSFAFLFFVLAAVLLVLTAIASARGEEASGRLEVLLAEPVARVEWLGGRLLLALAAAAALALVAAVSAWVGAAIAGASAGFTALLAAGANCLPVTVLFLGIGAAAFAAVPRHAVGFNYALLGVAFLADLFGPALHWPAWVLDLSHFHHVAAVPVAAFDGPAAAVMIAAGAAGVIAALYRFRQRDLATG